MNLEVHIHSEVHFVLWQSLPMGQKTSHLSPQLPVSHLAVIFQEPQVLPNYLPTHQPTRNESDRTRTATAQPAVDIVDQKCWFQDRKHNTIHHNSNKSTRISTPKPKVPIQTLKRQSS